MKKILALLLLVCFVLHAEADNQKPFVIPELSEWTGSNGDLVLSGRIVASGKEAQTIAKALASDYQAMFGRTLTVTSGKVRQGDFVLTLKKEDKTLGTEGYRLDIAENAVATAATPQGLFWATRSLLQILEASQGQSLPKGRATDVPKYKLRGFMIDCGRKYIPIDYLRKLTKVMAYYKMNTLQIHLNDNGFPENYGRSWDQTQAAFRMECETFPGLTAKDGFYTKKDFIDLQILAEQNFVDIIPEIDIPAHSLAFTQYKPELASEKYGSDHLDITKQETYDFCDALLKEYLSGKEPVFRSKRFHIGTDEYNKAEAENFRKFTDHYIRYAESFGKQACLWGSLTHAKGETPVKVDDVLMWMWSGDYANPNEMKELGYQMVSIPDGYVYIVPAAGYYYDYLNCKNLYENWTPAVMGRVRLEEGDPQIEGGMFAVWNDRPNGISVADIHHRTVPALQTISAKCWSGQSVSVPYEEFDAKRLTLSEAPGVNELGRLAQPFVVAELSSGQTLNGGCAGYDYKVSFDVDCKAESKGAVLLENCGTRFYLADPRDGKLGFERDGYLNTFNYRLPQSGKVTIRIEGTNRETRLYVNDRHIETLGMQTLYSGFTQATYQDNDPNAQKFVMYLPNNARMYYMRTLVFPLEKAGVFNSRVTNLKAENM
ncbi:MAG: family 20 glycosylhydrolase [Christensenellaceae bacterium]|nr:family 20 glycosylhydrolase [Christensenellaceae bacterium]